MSSVHGIVLLDKPLGLSSNQALTRLKRILKADKAGHTGSLDPLATGMLPCCFGEATKVAGYLLGRKKKYEALISLGATTTTADREGDLLEVKTVPTLSLDEIKAIAALFVGKIKQTPPMYSALKRNGVPLYRLARQGKVVDVPEREIEIFEILVNSFEANQISMTVECGSGTYIRSLAVDIGSRIGCGGHLGALRRLWVDPFQTSPMHSLEQIEHFCNSPDAAQNMVQSIDIALSDWPRLELTESEVAAIRQGKAIKWNQPASLGLCRLYTPDGTILAMAEYGDDGLVKPKRLFCLP
jgi:tRNA pseudouridine55 synthase